MNDRFAAQVLRTQRTADARTACVSTKSASSHQFQLRHKLSYQRRHFMEVETVHHLDQLLLNSTDLLASLCLDQSSILLPLLHLPHKAVQATLSLVRLPHIHPGLNHDTHRLMRDHIHQPFHTLRLSATADAEGKTSHTLRLSHHQTQVTLHS